MSKGPKPRPVIDRFWEKVDRTETCWLWRAAKFTDGYGQFSRIRARPVRAHRFSYELTHGPIPAGFVVMHACDNPLCVNPAHLSLGTPKENIHDSIRKGRRPGNV